MTVWNTIANMMTLDASVQSFFRVIEEKINDQDCWRLIGSEEESSSTSANGWCCYAWYIRYPLRRVPHGEEHNRGPANLTVGLELWREVTDQGEAWQYAKQPLVYVGFSPGKDNYWGEDMACDYRGRPAHEEVVSPTQGSPICGRGMVKKVIGGAAVTGSLS